MKNFIKQMNFLVIAAILFISGLAIADVTLYDNGTNKGRVESVNVKGAAITRSGQQGIIDMRSLSGINWVTVGAINNININWLTANTINGASVNWTSMPQSIKNVGVNWSDIKVAQQTSTGVNWTLLDPVSGGINWAQFQPVTTGGIMCWKSNGQPGKCTTSVSGVLCTACN